MEEEKISNCRWCSYLHLEFDGPIPEALYSWYKCRVTSNDNLKNFPFNKTRCTFFKKRNIYLFPTLDEALKECRWKKKEKLQ